MSLPLVPLCKLGKCISVKMSHFDTVPQARSSSFKLLMSHQLRGWYLTGILYFPLNVGLYLPGFILPGWESLEVFRAQKKQLRGDSP